MHSVRRPRRTPRRQVHALLPRPARPGKEPNSKHREPPGPGPRGPVLRIPTRHCIQREVSVRRRKLLTTWSGHGTGGLPGLAVVCCQESAPSSDQGKRMFGEGIMAEDARWTFDTMMQDKAAATPTAISSRTSRASAPRRARLRREAQGPVWGYADQLEAFRNDVIGPMNPGPGRQPRQPTGPGGRHPRPRPGIPEPPALVAEPGWCSASAWPAWRHWRVCWC